MLLGLEGTINEIKWNARWYSRRQYEKSQANTWPSGYATLSVRRKLNYYRDFSGCSVFVGTPCFATGCLINTNFAEYEGILRQDAKLSMAESAGMAGWAVSFRRVMTSLRNNWRWAIFVLFHWPLLLSVLRLGSRSPARCGVMTKVEELLKFRSLTQ